MSDETILFIANTVRRRFDHGDMDAPLYTLCAVVSAELSEALTKASIAHHIAYVDSTYGGHVYIRIEDKILDLTAKQFDMSLPSIVYAPVSELPKATFWSEKCDEEKIRFSYKFNSAKDLIKHQKMWHWPGSQINQRILKEAAI